MKFTRTSFQASLALVLVGGLTLSAPGHAQTAPLLKLTRHLPTGTTVCEFQTDNGVTVTGGSPGQVSASGNFVGTGCPTSTGGVTGQASVTITADPTTVAVGNPVDINWQGVGDICRYEGSSPPVVGWPSSGVACLGATECATGGQFTHSFVNGGGTQYVFSLSCATGINAEQPNGSADVGTASVTVTGGTPPPTSSCVNVPGLTRQMTGPISSFGGNYDHSDVRLEYWSDVMGWQFAGDLNHHEWPGYTPNSPKVSIERGKYIAMEFHVDGNFPYTDPYSGAPGGSITTVDSQATVIGWSLSISEECGDFDRPAPGDPRYYCYADFTVFSGALGWAVPAPGDSAPPFTCPLERDTTYYLNIVPADMATPTSSNCPAGVGMCKFNLYNGGVGTAGTYDECTAAPGTCAGY